MRTLLSPPEGYPVALVGSRLHIVDFGVVLENATFPEAVEVIHTNLRRRFLANEYFPFASSVGSIETMFPDASILIAPTHGWDHASPLAHTEEE